MRSINLRPSNFSFGAHLTNAAPSGSQQYRAPMCVLRAPGVTRIKLFADTADLFARRHSLIDWRRDFTSFSTPGRSSSSLTSVCDGAMGAKPNFGKSETVLHLRLVAVRQAARLRNQAQARTTTARRNRKQSVKPAIASKRFACISSGAIAREGIPAGAGRLPRAYRQASLTDRKTLLLPNLCQSVGRGSLKPMAI